MFLGLQAEMSHLGAEGSKAWQNGAEGDDDGARAELAADPRRA
jgi:hypothetical protein